MRVCLYDTHVIILLWVLYDIVIMAIHLSVHVNGIFQNIHNSHYELVPLIGGTVYIQITNTTNFVFIRD